MISSIINKEFDNYNNIDIENLELKDQKNLQSDLFIFQKLKNTISDLQTEINQLRQEIYQLKETNNHLMNENQTCEIKSKPD